MPHIFTRITNADEVLSQYNHCTPAPFLNKIDSILGGEQCSQSFSYPRFFFNEWYKSEVKRQEKKKDEKRKRKKERRVRREAKNKEVRELEQELSIIPPPYITNVLFARRFSLSAGGQKANEAKVQEDEILQVPIQERNPERNDNSPGLPPQGYKSPTAGTQTPTS